MIDRKGHKILDINEAIQKLINDYKNPPPQQKFILEDYQIEGLCYQVKNILQGQPILL